MGSEPCECAGFVLTHEAAISGDVGGENGREPAFHPLSAQCFLPNFIGVMAKGEAAIRLAIPAVAARVRCSIMSIQAIAASYAFPNTFGEGYPFLSLRLRWKMINRTRLCASRVKTDNG